MKQRARLLRSKIGAVNKSFKGEAFFLYSHNQSFRLETTSDTTTLQGILRDAPKVDPAPSDLNAHFLTAPAMPFCKTGASRTTDAPEQGAICAVSRTRSLERLQPGKYVPYCTARVFLAGKYVSYATEPLRFARSVPMNATKRVFLAGKYVLNSTARNVFPRKYTPYCTTRIG